jgi:hypothetical protein
VASIAGRFGKVVVQVGGCATKNEPMINTGYHWECFVLGLVSHVELYE